jgi:carboxyvinyl-carboxyphosphonate phosphorylmutase
LEKPGLIVAPGAYDGLTALLVEQAGFPAVYATGGGIARSMGYPDLGLLTMTEIIERVENMVEVTKIPVIADCDTGYGNAINAMRAIRHFERAGAAGVHIEDQITPKKCGHYEGKQLIPVREMVPKLKACLQAREDKNFLVIARTDARAVEGFEGAIQRAKAYAEAGADVLFVEAPQSEEEIREIPKQIKAPLLINMFRGGKTPEVPLRQLEEWGYKIAIVPSSPQLAAIRAMKDLLEALKRDGTLKQFADRMITFKERDEIVDLPRYSQLEKRFLE